MRKTAVPSITGYGRRLLCLWIDRPVTPVSGPQVELQLPPDRPPGRQVSGQAVAVGRPPDAPRGIFAAVLPVVRSPACVPCRALFAFQGTGSEEPRLKARL